MISEVSKTVVLARYGSVPQVARFAITDEDLSPVRGDQVVVTTDRGEEVAYVLEQLRTAQSEDLTGEVIREASVEDLQRVRAYLARANDQFGEWVNRISEWKLQLELIDLEWTLDEKLVLYVLNERNAETTRLALLTAAKGLGIVHVQPVAAEGVVMAESGGGGCGSGGCGSGGCGSH